MDAWNSVMGIAVVLISIDETILGTTDFTTYPYLTKCFYLSNYQWNVTTGDRMCAAIYAERAVLSDSFVFSIAKFFIGSKLCLLGVYLNGTSYNWGNGNSPGPPVVNSIWRYGSPSTSKHSCVVLSSFGLEDVACTGNFTFLCSSDCGVTSLSTIKESTSFLTTLTPSPTTKTNIASVAVSSSSSNLLLFANITPSDASYSISTSGTLPSGFSLSSNAATAVPTNVGTTLTINFGAILSTNFSSSFVIMNPTTLPPHAEDTISTEQPGPPSANPIFSQDFVNVTSQWSGSQVSFVSPLSSTTPLAQTASSPSVYTSGLFEMMMTSSGCYCVGISTGTHNSSEQLCRELGTGSALAQLTTLDQFLTVTGVLFQARPNDQFWVSTYGVQGQGYFWSDGTPIPADSGLWGTGEPDGESLCVRVLWQASKAVLADIICQKGDYYAICETQDNCSSCKTTQGGSLSNTVPDTTYSYKVTSSMSDVPLTNLTTTTTHTLTSSRAPAAMNQKSTANHLCNCPCSRPPLPSTTSALSRKVAIEQELLVDKSTLSSRIRLKTSAVDKRVSSTNMGLLGLAFLVVVCVCVVISDVSRLVVALCHLAGQ